MSFIRYLIISFIILGATSSQSQAGSLLFRYCLWASRLPVSSASKAYATQAYLYVDPFTDKDRVNGNPELKFDLFAKRLQEKKPEARCHYIHAPTPEFLQQQLDEVLQPEDEIAGCLFDGHGESSVVKDSNGKATHVSVCLGFTQGKSLETFSPVHGEVDLSKPSLVLPRGQHVEVSLREKKEVTPYEIEQKNEKAERTFRGIQDRFSPDARVMFLHCNLLEGSQGLAGFKATALAKTLGLKNGTLYGNECAGSEQSVFFKQGFWQQKTSCEKSRFFNAQVALPGVIGTGMYLPYISSDPWGIYKGWFIGFAAQFLLAYAIDDTLNQGYRCEFKSGALSDVQYSSVRKFRKELLKK